MEITQNKIHINFSEDENPNFIKIVEDITNELIFKYDAAELSLVKIKNWFDNKWLNYSGIGIVEFNSGGILKIDASLEPKWNDKITVPPFNPNRVLSEMFFQRKESDNKISEKPLHFWQTSSNNLNNRIISKSSDAIYVWYSSNTENNQKGCIMVYVIKNENIETWYASIENLNGWKITKTKGIELNSLKEILQ